MAIDALTISTKGQAVIPSEMRKALSLSNGDKIVAYCANGSIVLKKLELPKQDEFERAVEETSRFAKESGLK